MQSLIALFCWWFLQFELILRLAQLLSHENVLSVNFAYLAGFEAIIIICVPSLSEKDRHFVCEMNV